MLHEKLLIIVMGTKLYIKFFLETKINFEQGGSAYKTVWLKMIIILDIIRKGKKRSLIILRVSKNCSTEGSKVVNLSNFHKNQGLTVHARFDLFTFNLHPEMIAFNFIERILIIV